jgi:RNase P subunit RPR2
MASQARELLRLLRLPSNRTCADCDAPLTDPTNVWVSVTHGVFICVNCVSVHRKVSKQHRHTVASDLKPSHAL